VAPKCDIGIAAASCASETPSSRAPERRREVMKALPPGLRREQFGLARDSPRRNLLETAVVAQCQHEDRRDERTDRDCHEAKSKIP
jgi:hypothetical protein